MQTLREQHRFVLLQYQKWPLVALKGAYLIHKNIKIFLFLDLKLIKDKLQKTLVTFHKENCGRKPFCGMFVICTSGANEAGLEMWSLQKEKKNIPQHPTCNYDWRVWCERVFPAGSLFFWTSGGWDRGRILNQFEWLCRGGPTAFPWKVSLLDLHTQKKSNISLVLKDSNNVKRRQQQYLSTHVIFSSPL